MISVALRMRTKVRIFIFFPTAFKQQQKKLKELRPKMTKIASNQQKKLRGPALRDHIISSSFVSKRNRFKMGGRGLRPISFGNGQNRNRG